MKIHISVDYEGCAGVFKWIGRNDPDAGGHLSIRRRLMTEEVNAAIEGVLAVDPEAEILVADSHGSARNLLPETLHTRAELIGGWPRVQGMVEGLDATCDFLFLIGYHARVGAPGGGMDHTFSDTAVHEIRVDGRPVGETELNAAVGGHYGVPLALVSGDDVLMRDLAEVVDPKVRRVVVKTGISRFAARSLHPDQARRLIRTAAEAVVGDPSRPAPFRYDGNCTLEVELTDSDMAYVAEGFPGVDRTGDRTFRFHPVEDYLTLYKRLMVFLNLARSWE
ncbi:MAG: M55 family metallopeptidase [Planctomycetota bacterium]|jgi:D-amino peptidase